MANRRAIKYPPYLPSFPKVHASSGPFNNDLVRGMARAMNPGLPLIAIYSKVVEQDDQAEDGYLMSVIEETGRQNTWNGMIWPWLQT